MSLSECYKECNYLRETDNRLMSHCIWETYYKMENTRTGVQHTYTCMATLCSCIYIYRYI